MRAIATVALLMASITPAYADLDSMTKATELGSILAAEEFCGLSYNQDAIETWIDENTDPKDMGFPSTLTMMISGNEYQQKELSNSAKTAHCRSIKRIAKQHSFID